MTRTRIPGTIIATLILGLTTTVTSIGATERPEMPVWKNPRRRKETINENDENEKNFVRRNVGNSRGYFGAGAEWLPCLPRLWSPSPSFQQVANGIGERMPSTRSEKVQISFFASLNSGYSRPDAGPTEPHGERML